MALSEGSPPIKQCAQHEEDEEAANKFPPGMLFTKLEISSAQPMEAIPPQQQKWYIPSFKTCLKLAKRQEDSDLSLHHATQSSSESLRKRELKERLKSTNFLPKNPLEAELCNLDELLTVQDLIAALIRANQSLGGT